MTVRSFVENLFAVIGLITLGFLTAMGVMFIISPPAHADDFYVVKGQSTGSNGSNGDTFQVGFSKSITDTYGVSLGYMNEGSITNNHRDGFVVQGYYERPVLNKVYLGLAAGPYLAMNTTNVNGNQLNNKELGLVISPYLKWYPTSSNWYVRLQGNYNAVASAPNSYGILAGVGFDYQSRNAAYPSSTNVVVGLYAGASHTTRGGSTTAVGYQLEVKNPVANKFSGSISYLNEGNTGIVNRQGVVIQGWYDHPASQKWTLSAGIGPYFYSDALNNKSGVMAVGTLQASYEVVKDVAVNFRFNRVMSSYDKDQDMFMLGVQKRF